MTAPSYIYDLIWEKTTNASTADIRKGETQTLRNLLYAMMLPSANEAAYIVADYMGGGSIDNFVAMMNEEAARIGCTGTTFADPCGLDTNNVTTARDAYLILRALTSYDIFATVVSTPSYDMGTNDRYTTPGTYVIQNTDKMLNEGSAYYPISSSSNLSFSAFSGVVISGSGCPFFSSLDFSASVTIEAVSTDARLKRSTIRLIFDASSARAITSTSALGSLFLRSARTQ